MPTYKPSAVTAKEGINFIRSTVESGGSLFHKIEQENDLGIDALIEFVEGGRPLSKQIAIQVKSGPSYHATKSKACFFPVDGHEDYWRNYPLPVIGLVYIPSLDCAHWIDIKAFLKANPGASTIRFTASQANKFDALNFAALFQPTMLGQTPTLSVATAIQLAQSKNTDEALLGLMTLFRGYPDDPRTWDELVRYVADAPVEEIHPILIYWLAHIPWHPDIAHSGKLASPETRAYARRLFEKWDTAMVVKLLSFIDPEQTIARGSIGQSVQAIISSLPRSGLMLRDVISEDSHDMELREYAAFILAMDEAEAAVPTLSQLHAEGSWLAGELVHQVQVDGGVYPYS